MQVTTREVFLHFRTNPISALVGLLLVLLFGVVLRFSYHIDIGMSHKVMVHDEVQHLQIKDAYLVQHAISELRQVTRNQATLAEFSVDDAWLQALCQRNAQFARLQWAAIGAAPQELLCHETYQADSGRSNLASSVMSGVALALVGLQQYALEQQYIRVTLPLLDANGRVQARLMVDYSLGGLPDSRTSDHAHGVAQTMLLETQSPWRGEQANHDIARGAGRLSRIKISEAGQFRNNYGFYIVHPVRIVDTQNGAVIARWRLLSWIPPLVFEHHWRDFWVHAGYVLLAFIVLIFAMFFYSQRIIREQVDLLSDLKDQKNFLNSLFNSSSDGMLTLGMNGNIQSCNTRAEVLFSYRPGSLLGRPIERLLPSGYQTNDQNYIEIYLQLSRPDQNYSRQELVGVRSGGEILAVEVSYSQLQIAGDDRLLLIIREITERKVAEKELDALRLQYFQQEKMSQIGLLMTGILHEVGNPIAAIQGLLEEVLHEDEGQPRNLLSDQHRGNLELVMQQANRIRAIAQDVSGFASPNQSERGLLSLNAILEATAKLLSYDKRLRGVDLVMDLDSQLPAFEAVADQLTQVFMNLLVNALDALLERADPSPQLLIATHKLAEGILLVIIRDNGCGIDDVAMRHIFDSFYTTKPKGKGSGLGLSICEKLIEENGGQLELESERGRGTEIRIYFESKSECELQEMGVNDALS